MTQYVYHVFDGTRADPVGIVREGPDDAVALAKARRLWPLRRSLRVALLGRAVEVIARVLNGHVVLFRVEPLSWTAGGPDAAARSTTLAEYAATRAPSTPDEREEAERLVALWRAAFGDRLIVRRRMPVNGCAQ